MMKTLRTQILNLQRTIVASGDPFRISLPPCRYRWGILPLTAFVIATTTLIHGFADEATDVTFGPEGSPKTAVTHHVSKTQKSGSFATIQSAIDAAMNDLEKGKSVTIKIDSGIYYESPRLDMANASELARKTVLVIEGAANGTTIISGLEPEGFEPNTWKPVKGESTIFEHSWDKKHGLNWGPEPDRVAKMIQPELMRRELVVIDGVKLFQKELMTYKWIDPDGPRKKVVGGKVVKNLDTKPGRMVYQGLQQRGLSLLDKPWTFLVVDNDKAPANLRNRIFVRLPDGKNMNTVKRIGVSRLVSPEAKEETATSLQDALFRIANKENLILRNLMIQHAGTALYGAGLLLLNVNGCLLKNVNVSQNNGNGLTARRVNNFTVSGCKFDFNGHNGATFYGHNRNGHIQNTSFSFNQDRAFESGYRGATQAGIKIVSAPRNITLTKCVVLGNRRGGFWTDANGIDVVYQNCLALGNGGFGFFAEFSNKRGHGDVVRQCVSAFNEVGIRTGEVRKARLENNLLFFNDSAFSFRNIRVRVPNTPDDIGYIRVTGNEVYAGSASIAKLTGSTILLPAMELNNNRYYCSSKKKLFIFTENKKNKYLDFDDWKRQLSGNKSPEMRENETILELNRAVRGESMLFDKTSVFYRKANRLGVPLPLGAMKLALKRYKGQAVKDSSFADDN